MHPREFAHPQITPTPEQRERHVTNSLQSVDHTAIIHHSSPPAQTVQLTTQFPSKMDVLVKPSNDDPVDYHIRSDSHG